MNKIIYLTVAAVAVIVIVAIAFYWGRSATNAPATQAVSQTTTTTTSPTTPSPKTSAPTSAPTVYSPEYSIVTPAAGAVWALNQPHLISWNKATSITGAIYLEDPATGNIVGWLLSSTGPNQISYMWDGTYVSTGRTLPTKITPPPGTYRIVVKMDNKPPTTMTSGKFSLVAGQ